MIDGFYGQVKNTGKNHWKIEFFHESEKEPLFTCHCGNMHREDAMKDALESFKQYLQEKTKENK